MNEEQIEFWNGPPGQRWAAGQDEIDTAFRKLDEALFGAVKISPGEKILDVGCGCGTTTFRLAELTGADGYALGVDIAKHMLDIAETRAREINSSAAFLEADAAQHDFSAMRFDLLFSRFGVMFFDNPFYAFKNLRKAMRVDGLLCFLCWRSDSESC